jgi:hypothetical protein
VKKKYFLVHKTMVEATKKGNKLLVETLHKIHDRTMVTQRVCFQTSNWTTSRKEIKTSTKIN